MTAIDDLHIRPMQAGDLAAVHRIDEISFPTPWPLSRYTFEYNNPRISRCWVAEREGHVLGSLIAWMILDEFHIATLSVHPDYRRQGIATQLLTKALEGAAQEGGRRGLLEVREGNLHAQALYRCFGFQPVGRRRRYYENKEDAILMTLEDIQSIRLPAFAPETA